MIKTIAFDCDDTLWNDNYLFDEAKDQFKQIILSYTDETGVRTKMEQRHIDNLPVFGYGAKSFTLSMVETAVAVTAGKISATDIQKLIDIGKDMLHTPMELLNQVEETLKKLSVMDDYKIMAITKGDLFAQEIKMERSGLKKYFDVVEIVSEKDTQSYQEIFDLYRVNPKNLLMIGNSMKSDILPILELGGHAAHVPHHTTWEHEKVEAAELNDKQFLIFKCVDEVFDVLEKAKTITDDNFERLYLKD